MITSQHRQLLQEYLRIDTSLQNIASNCTKCVDFFRKSSEALGLSCQIIEQDKSLPVILIMRKDYLSSDNCLLLNSHYDVVPASEAQWKYPPYGGMVIDDKVYGRGAQDCKSLTIGAMIALSLIESPLLRPVVISVMPDEEVGGVKGMNVFCHSNTFKDLKVVQVIDEGLPCPTDRIYLFPDEREAIWIQIKVKSKAAHASIPTRSISAIDKLITFLLWIRNEFQNNSETIETIGETITANITRLQAGYADNVVPEEANGVLDVRLPRKVIGKTLAQMEKKAYEIGIVLNYTKPCSIEGLDSKMFVNSISTLLKNEFDICSITSIFPGATDSRYLRAQGIPCIGMSPIRNCPVLLHAEDEYIPIASFSEAIGIYKAIILALCQGY